VGGIEGFERLGIETIYNLPVAVGNGWVEAAHGRLPVPAPATAILLEGVDAAQGGPVEGEATTPTGAALVRVLSQGAPPAHWRLTGSGWGAGQRLCSSRSSQRVCRICRPTAERRVAYAADTT